MKKIFFVVPVYNVEIYLKRCVDSLVNQTYENTEIVLVDDGSKDSSGSMCDEYAKKYDNISVIHQENGGLSAARNTGIEYCLENGDETDYIVFVDSDDFIDITYGECMIDIAERHGAHLVQCRYEKGSGNEFTVCENHSEYAVSNVEALLGYELKSQTWGKLYELNLFDDIRFIENVYNEDEFTTYKLVYNAKKVGFSSKKLYYYYQRSDGIMYTLARKLKNNPHKNDIFDAYAERYGFFKVRGEKDLMLRTKEKVCTDIILRYSEQMNLPKNERDCDVVGGEYMRNYKRAYKEMMKRKGMPFKRRLMFTAFYVLPISAYWASKVTDLRK